MEIQYSERTIKFFEFVCVISNLSYFPIFQQSSYGRYFVLGVWGIALLRSVFCGRSIAFYRDAFTKEILIYLCFIICSTITFVFGGTKVFNNHFFSTVSIAMLIMVIGYLNGEYFSEYGIYRLSLIYMHSMFVISVPLFVFYLRGTDLSSITYAYSYGKNEIAVLFLCAGIFAVVLYSPKTLFQTIYKFVGLAFVLVDLAFLRCRSAILCVAIAYIFLVFKSKSLSHGKRRILILLGIVGFFFLISNESVRNTLLTDILFAQRDSTNLDSLSSGRLQQITQGLEVFKENFFAGVGYRQTLDCFYISALANYGIGAWSIIALALMPMFWAAKRLRYENEIYATFFLVVLSLFIVSLLEELAPFGSGVRCYVLWLMWGILIKKELYDEEDQ